MAEADGAHRHSQLELWIAGVAEAVLAVQRASEALLEGKRDAARFELTTANNALVGVFERFGRLDDVRARQRDNPRHLR